MTRAFSFITFDEKKISIWGNKRSDEKPLGANEALDLFRARQRADAFGSDQTCSDLFPVYPQIRNVLKLPMINW